MSNPNARPVRFVVFHQPGPKWQMGVDIREQDAGGMMVETQGVSQEGLMDLLRLTQQCNPACLFMKSAHG